MVRNRYFWKNKNANPTISVIFFSVGRQIDILAENGESFGSPNGDKTRAHSHVTWENIVKLGWWL